MGWPWRRGSGRHAAPAQRPPSPAETVPASVPTVLLGFRDGSEVQLDERDPNALALLAVADLLVQDPAISAETTTGGPTTERRTR